MSYKLKLIVLHLYIADREGMNGEDIQIGEGDVVLKDLIEHLDKNSICAQFVLEIWQGHKDFGRGFCLAKNAPFASPMKITEKEEKYGWEEGHKGRKEGVEDGEKRCGEQKARK